MIRFENCLTPLKNALSYYIVNGFEFLLIMTFDLSLGVLMESFISPHVIFFLVCFLFVCLYVFLGGMTHKCPINGHKELNIFTDYHFGYQPRDGKEEKNYRTSCPVDRTELSKFTGQFQIFSDNTLPHPLYPHEMGLF